MDKILRGLGLVAIAAVMLTSGPAAVTESKTSGAGGHKDEITWPCPDDRTA